ncbi:hypothetical protein SAMN05660662_2367 [Blastococcus aurantiacus]|uniref:DUF222 domain-containing protein n=1 Tax=Blastococcus aurantiacus TaxID=1550231 RepID=A0A1G7LKB4_9ACTN|nr:hypothetical protein SAMN05660662_2367 [Blastococcus aurantiacus]
MPARRKLSEVAASIPLVNRTESRSPALLPPVTLTPEEAAAVAVALAAQPDGPFADAGRLALEKVLAVLEPDPHARAELRDAGRRTSAQLRRSASEPGSRSRHPAGRARRPEPDAVQPPRLVLLPGGRA